MLKNTETFYGLLTRIFHWINAYIIIGLLIVGTIMVDMDDSPQKWKLYNLHKATGMLILIIVILRFTWKSINLAVILPKTTKDWQKKAAAFAHLLLYFLMFLMPISGIAMSLFGGHDISVFGFVQIAAFNEDKELSSLFASAHTYVAYTLATVIIGHILAAFYHHFVLKDNVLMRMIKG